MDSEGNIPEKKEKKPVFWESEDGEFYPVDPNNIEKCSVCGNWYQIKNFHTTKNICSPGCHLRLTETTKRCK